LRQQNEFYEPLNNHQRCCRRDWLRSSRAAGGKVSFLAADMTSAEDWDAVKEAPLSHYGKIDVLINKWSLARPSAYQFDHQKRS